MTTASHAQAPAVATPTTARDPATQATNDRATAQLFEAVQANDLNLVQASVASGANIRATDRWGLTPAEIAVDKGNFEIAHFLISIQNAQRANAAPAANARKVLPPVATPTAPVQPMTSAGRPLTYRNYSATQRADSGHPLDRGASPTRSPFDPSLPVMGGDLRPINDAAMAPPTVNDTGPSTGAQ